MTQPTRQEIIEAQIARQWAEWNKSCEVSSPEIQAAADFILAHTTPPTMAEIEWDDDKHYLAEAEHVTLGKVVMIHPATDARIRCLCKWYGPHWVYNLTPAHLTLTGRRYTLTEEQE